MSPVVFFIPMRTETIRTQRKTTPTKIHFKTYCKAESIGITQHFDYSTFDSYSFSLLFKLNGTHVRSRWSVTRSEAVCEYLSFQSISWTSKADVSSFSDYRLSRFFYSFWCKNGAKHRSTTRRTPVSHLCLHLVHASTCGVFESCLPVHT